MGFSKIRMKRARAGAYGEGDDLIRYLAAKAYIAEQVADRTRK
jgi:hypothetical protein